MAEHTQKGSILIMTLLMLVAFVVIVTAWAQFASRQSRSIVDQKQEEQAFALSEAGIEYTLFLLNSGEYTPGDLVNDGDIVATVDDPVSRDPVGIYELKFSGGGSSLAVTSTGHDWRKVERCQEIDAVIDSFTGAVGGTQYYVRTFDHKNRVSCELPPPPNGATVRFARFFSVHLEGDVQAQFEIRLSIPTTVPVEVTFKTVDGSATGGSDFESVLQRVRFEPGESSKTIPVQIIDDSIRELPIEFFTGRLENSNATISRDSQTVLIVDDDLFRR